MAVKEWYYEPYFNTVTGYLDTSYSAASHGDTPDTSGNLMYCAYEFYVSAVSQSVLNRTVYFRATINGSTSRAYPVVFTTAGTYKQIVIEIDYLEKSISPAANRIIVMASDDPSTFDAGSVYNTTSFRYAQQVSEYQNKMNRLTYRYDTDVYSVIPARYDSTCSQQNVVIGNDVTIRTFTYARRPIEVTIALDESRSVTQMIRSVNSFVISIPVEWGAGIQTSFSKTATVTVRTYMDMDKEVQVGDDSVGTITISIPVENAPTYSGGWITLENTLPVKTYGYIATQSSVRVSIDQSKLSLKYGATLAGYTLDIGYQSLTLGPATASYTSNPIETVGTVPISVTATDSRGKTVTFSTSISVKAYEMPSIRNIVIKRVSPDGSLYVDDEEGQVLHVYAVSSCASSVGQKSFTVGYKKRSDDTYTYMTLTSGSASYIINFLLNYSWDVKLVLTDNINNTATYETVVQYSYPVLNFPLNGNGMAIGMYANRDGLSLGWNLYLDRGKKIRSMGTTDKVMSYNLLEDTPKIPDTPSEVGAAPAVHTHPTSDVVGLDNKIGSALSYSTEETLTGGTWIDGKPIYRVVSFDTTTYSFPKGSDTTRNVPTHATNVDTVIQLHALRYDSDGNQGVLPQTNSNGSAMWSLTATSLKETPSVLGVRYFGYAAQSGIRVLIVMEYTKK